MIAKVTTLTDNGGDVVEVEQLPLEGLAAGPGQAGRHQPRVDGRHLELGAVEVAGRPGLAVSLVSRDSQPEQALVDEVERCVRGAWKFV